MIPVSRPVIRGPPIATPFGSPRDRPDRKKTSCPPPEKAPQERQGRSASPAQKKERRRRVEKSGPGPPGPRGIDEGQISDSGNPFWRIKEVASELERYPHHERGAGKRADVRFCQK